MQLKPKWYFLLQKQHFRHFVPNPTFGEKFSAQ
jgi:hypothetical protein